MRVAFVGKGGSGKSTIAGTMARLVARGGTPVLALDSDPLPGISLSLGSGPEPDPPPMLGASRKDETGQWGWSEGITAAIAAQRFSTPAPDGVRLLGRGKVGREGSGPILGASKGFWETVHGLVDAPEFADWTLIGDLSAGPHQIARDWAPYAQTYVVVVLPTAQSALTARRVAKVARLQSPEASIVYVANRVRGEQDVRHVERLVGHEVLAHVPLDAGVAAAERIGAAPLDHAPDAPAIAAIGQLAEQLAESAGARAVSQRPAA